MGWGHPGSPAQSPWGGRPCWSPPTCVGYGPTAPGQPLSITTCGTRPPPARRSEQICFPPMPQEAPCACVTGWRHWWHWEEARSRAPPSPVTAPRGSATGEQQPPLGGAGSPPCQEAAGAVVIPARAAAAAHKASAQGRALVFEKSQNRARAEPPLRLRGCARRAPRALGEDLKNWGCPRAAHQLPNAGSPSPPDVPWGSHGVAVPRVSRTCREGEGPAAPRAPEAPGWESPWGAGGRGAAGPGFVPAAPQHPPHRSSPLGQEEQSCSAHAGHGPSHSPTCPGPQLVMLGWILRWEKHPDPPQTPVGCRKKGAEPHGSHP